jgi:hypothetical protein
LRNQYLLSFGFHIRIYLDFLVVQSDNDTVTLDLSQIRTAAVTDLHSIVQGLNVAVSGQIFVAEGLIED